MADTRFAPAIDAMPRTDSSASRLKVADAELFTMDNLNHISVTCLYDTMTSNIKYPLSLDPIVN